jgi:serine/threonine-protein kinase
VIYFKFDIRHSTFAVRYSIFCSFMTEITSRLSTALADRYRIERRLGEGGMATVYLAQDSKHDRKVALKVLRPELAAVLGAERFVQEIKTTASLQHPNILPLFDSGEADSFLYYVMPFVEGETIRDKLNRETQFSVDEAVKIASDVADALDYAHRQNVIHRDIKPENILLHDGRPMVADFGIALAVSAAAGGRMTETGLSLGTPHYMSPEQATAEKDITSRSDIYSLGSVLYEMLTGEPPHSGGSAQAIIMKILSDTPRPVTELRKSVPPHVAAATAKSLEKLAADRFESAARFAQALADPTFSTAVPTTVGVGAVGSRPGHRWQRFVWPVAAVVLAGAALWGWLRPEPPKPVSRYSMALPEGEALAQTSWARVAISPDGEQMVYSGLTSQGPRLLVRARDQLHATPLPGTEDAVNPFFSPDGNRVGFFTTISPREIKVVSLAGGPPITVVDSLVGLPGATWGTDGYIYFDAVGIGPLLRVPASGGMPVPIAALDTAQGEQQHNWPDVLPNGRGVIFTINRAGPGFIAANMDIAVLDLSTGKHTVLVRGAYARYAVSGHLVYTTGDGTLMVVPFDQDKLALTGEAIGLVEGLAVGSAGAVDLALSATGTLVYATGAVLNDPEELVWVARDGTAEQIDPGWVGAFSSVALSPDESSLAVTVEGANVSQIWIKQLPSGPFTRLSLEGSINNRARWTPDGRAVTFLSNRSDFGVFASEVYVRRADGSALAERLVDEERPLSEALVSRDGAWLVARTTSPNQDIVAYPLKSDGVPIPLVTTDAQEFAPSLSPDGRWLAYTSTESGGPEVYVAPFPNTGEARWAVSTGGGNFPVWARHGRQLFYRSADDELVAVEVIPGPAFAMGQRRVLFSMRPYGGVDVTEDDRFVMIRRRGAESASELIVVENFFEELKAKVGN